MGGGGGGAAAGGAAKRPRDDDGAQHRHKRQHTAAPEAAHGGGDERSRRKEAKALADARKARRNPRFPTIQKMVGIWEKLRVRDAAKETRHKLVGDVLKLAADELGAYATSHKASRVIQACFKHGSAEQRRAISAAVIEDLVEMAKSEYGYHLAMRVCAEAAPSELPKLVAPLRGHVPTLVRHPAGARVVDELYNRCSEKVRRSLRAEMYGSEFKLAGASTQFDGLSAELDGAPRERRTALLRSAHMSLAPVWEKGLVDCALVQTALAELLRASESHETAVEMAESLCGEPMLHMLHTKDGSEVAIHCLAVASAKERKKFAKALRGHVVDAAKDKHGVSVLCHFLAVTDDTQLSRKQVLGDLCKALPLREEPPDAAKGDENNPNLKLAREHAASKETMEDWAKHAHASKVLLTLLRMPHPDKRTWPPHQQELLTSGARMCTAIAEATAAAAAGDDADIAGDDDDDGGEDDNGGTGSAARVFRGSRKDHATRCHELLTGTGLGGGTTSLAARLVRCARNASGGPASWARAGGGASELLLEVCTNATLRESSPEDVDAIVTELAEVASVREGDDPLLTHYYGSRFLRRLALAPSPERCAHPARAVFDAAIKGNVAAALGTHAEKVVAALSDCPDAATRKACLAELKPALKKQATTLEVWKQRFVTQGGADAARK